MDDIKKYKISIVILNWNGKDDTLECLESLSELNYDNFNVIIVDNASGDDSIAAFKDFREKCSRFQIHIIVNNENLGFAKANNIGILKAFELEAEYILLLNNDTVSDKNCLASLNLFANKHPEFKVATPQIRYFEHDEIIWNCGGKINNWGIKKYYFEGKNFKILPQKDFIKISFITGCAMFVQTEVFKTHGLLSEDFFFGEEDIEFSLRLKSNNILCACVLNALVFHKVSASVAKASAYTTGKVFIHYLNRFINMKKHMSPFIWHIWRMSYLAYVMMILLVKHNIKIKSIFHFAGVLLKQSKILDKVDKFTFEKYFSFNF